MHIYYLRIILTSLLIYSTISSSGQTGKEYLKLVSSGTRVSPSNGKDTIPVELVNGWIVVKIRIGKTVKKMIWDTGTAFSAINDTDNNFEKIKESNITFKDIAGNNTNSNLYRLKGMSLGKFQFANLAFIVIDLKSTASGALSQFDGLLGLNIIDKLNWKFNFDESYVIVSDKPFDDKDGEEVRYANFVGYNTFLTRFKASNGKKVTAKILIDFGVTNSWIFLNNKFLQYFNGSKAEISKAASIGVSGIGEVENIYQINQPTPCTIGPKGKQITKELPIILSSRNGNNVIGSGFFTAYNFIRNSDKSTFILRERKQRKNNVTTKESYGIDFILNQQEGITVVGLTKNDVNNIDKINIGDHIVDINGKKPGMFNNNQELYSFIKGLLKNKETLKLTLNNGEKFAFIPAKPVYYTIE